MVPADFITFFTTCSISAATLIGLLFIAISTAPEETVRGDAPIEQQAVAASAFTTLANAFFIATGAQIPRLNVGIFAALLGLVGLFSTLSLLLVLLGSHPARQSLIRGLWLATASAGLYLVETWEGVRLIRHRSDVSALYVLDLALLGIFAVGLIRAWQLLGARRYGPLGWLSALPRVHAQPLNPAQAASGDEHDNQSGC
jgi:hypothetical protein